MTNPAPTIGTLGTGFGRDLPGAGRRNPIIGKEVQMDGLRTSLNQKVVEESGLLPNIETRDTKVSVGVSPTVQHARKCLTIFDPLAKKHGIPQGHNFVSKVRPMMWILPESIGTGGNRGLQ